MALLLYYVLTGPNQGGVLTVNCVEINSGTVKRVEGLV